MLYQKPKIEIMKEIDDVICASGDYHDPIDAPDSTDVSGDWTQKTN